MSGKNALDEFLPEIDLHLAPQEVRLGKIEVLARSAAPASPSSIQLWPMLAAALVAMGVSMLALAFLTQVGFSVL